MIQHSAYIIRVYNIVKPIYILCYLVQCTHLPTTVLRYLRILIISDKNAHTYIVFS